MFTCGLHTYACSQKPHTYDERAYWIIMEKYNIVHHSTKQGHPLYTQNKAFSQMSTVTGLIIPLEQALWSVRGGLSLHSPLHSNRWGFSPVWHEVSHCHGFQRLLLLPAFCLVISMYVIGTARLPSHHLARVHWPSL